MLDDLLGWALHHGWFLWGLIRSPVKGPKGNVEFLAWLGAAAPAEPVTPEEAIARALVEHAPDYRPEGQMAAPAPAWSESAGIYRRMFPMPSWLSTSARRRRAALVAALLVLFGAFW